MPLYTNFFWATFFILYDPLEFSTGACPTPSGLEIGKTHHCALGHWNQVELQYYQSFKIDLQFQNQARQGLTEPFVWLKYYVLHIKSLHRCCTGSHCYRTEYEKWADFGLLAHWRYCSVCTKKFHYICFIRIFWPKIG